MQFPQTRAGLRPVIVVRAHVRQLAAEKIGIYMGILNFLIVIPEFPVASVLGFPPESLVGDAPVYGLVIGGVSLFAAGRAVLRVDELMAKAAPQALAISEQPVCAVPRRRARGDR